MTTTLLAGHARSRLEQGRRRLTELKKQMDAELAQARTHFEQWLTPEGLSAKRGELEQAVRNRYQEEFTALRDVMAEDSHTLREHLGQHRPRIGNDAASLMRAQTKWDQVRMRLEAGMPMSKIIASADTETALAVREWAPAWLEAQAYTSGPTGLSGEPIMPDTDALLRSIDDRLAELDTGDFRAAVAYARAAEEVEAATTPLLEHHILESAGATTPTSGLGAAIAGRIAGRDAARRWVDPEQVEAS